MSFCSRGRGSASRTGQTPALSDTLNKWAVRILVECILVKKDLSHSVSLVDRGGGHARLSLLAHFFFITGRNEVVAKVIFLHLSAILFTGGVCLSACWDTTTQSRHPSRADTPPEQTPPWSRHPPGSRHTPPEQTPLEQTPPWEQTPRSRPPPWEADSGIRSMTGRYASYWNAFLFSCCFWKKIGWG